MARWIVGFVLIAHGIAHGVGVAGSLLGADLEGAPSGPTLAVGGAEPALASLFLVGLVLFFLAGGALIVGRPSWRPLTAVAAVVSMVPVVVWWDDAFVGAFFNLLAVLVVVARRIPGLPVDIPRVGGHDPRAAAGVR